MNVLLPLDLENRQKASLCALDECKVWALITLEEGKISSCVFYEKREDILEYVESVVLLNEQEYVWQFMQEGMIVLIAPFQRSIDDIIEAFLFKELHDLSV